MQNITTHIGSNRRKLFLFYALLFTLFSKMAAGTGIIQANSISSKAKQTTIAGIFPDSVKSVSILVVDYSRSNDSLIAADGLQTEFNQETSDGTFSCSFAIENPVYVLLNHETSNFSAFGVSASRYFTGGILLSPGDNLYVDARYSKMVGADYSYSGRGAKTQQCVQEIINNTKYYDSVIYNKRMSLSDSIATMVVATVNKYEKQLSKEIPSILKYHYVNMLAHDVSEIVQTTDAESEIGRIYYNREIIKRSEMFDLTDSALLYSIPNFDLIFARRAKVECNILGANPDSISQFRLDYYAKLKSNVSSFPLGERILARYIMRSMRTLDYNAALRSATHDFLTQYTNGYLYNAIKRRYSEYARQLSVGSIAYPFELRDTAGLLVKQTDLLGKVVLIDFMYTGCGGCAFMVPFLTKVEERFSKQDVAFVSISISKKAEGEIGWKAGIGRYSVPGSIQLYTEGLGAEHPIIKHYDIAVYPTLVLIDRTGKVVSTRAPTPGLPHGKDPEGEELTELIMHTLKAGEN